MWQVCKHVYVYKYVYVYVHAYTYTYTDEAVCLEISYPRIMQAVHIVLIKNICHTGSNWKSLFQVFILRKFWNIAIEEH